MTTVDPGQQQPSPVPPKNPPEPEPGQQQTPQTPQQGPKVHTEITDVKLLLKNQGPGVTHVHLGSGDDGKTIPLSALAEKLSSLPPKLHLFRDPRHDDLVDKLEKERVIVLASYQESAAYAAAYSLVTDERFTGKERKAFFPTRRHGRDDLDVHILADAQFLGDQPQILLIEIENQCPLLDSTLRMPWGASGKIRDSLESHSSYLILVVNEELFSTKKPALPYYPVSHLRYLLAPHLRERTDEYENRIRMLTGSKGETLRELYQRIADQLADGVHALEALIVQLEQARTLPLAERKERLQPVSPQDVFPTESEVHRAAAFVATYLPDLGQQDFDRLVMTLLGDSTTTVERVRQVVSRDNNVADIREQIPEKWADRWQRTADGVFRDCHLRPVLTSDGTWVIDFSESYLRRELRAYLERHYPWYVRRQCKVLQDSGTLFALDLSSAAVDGLVQLFVDRAVIDPAGFGSAWLVDLVRALQVHLKGGSPPESKGETLAWLVEAVIESRLRAHFHERLARLIRVMLEREPLRPMVTEFLDCLIGTRQHDALLDLVLYLARRLRFAPSFDPLYWMRRLLDQGSATVRERTANQQIELARESGPRIYEFLAVVRTWLPEQDRAPERFSTANRVALEFPFAYSFQVSALLDSDHYGEWPSRHPLFYALPPSDSKEARAQIASLVEWIVDPRGATLESADPSDPTRNTTAVRLGFIADLIEDWSWVLEGSGDDGSVEGRALFRTIFEEFHRSVSARDRSSMQRNWQRRQDEYLAAATNASGAERTAFVRRRARLDQLRRRFIELSSHPASSGSLPQNSGGMAS